MLTVLMHAGPCWTKRVCNEAWLAWLALHVLIERQVLLSWEAIAALGGCIVVLIITPFAPLAAHHVFPIAIRNMTINKRSCWSSHVSNVCVFPCVLVFIAEKLA